jgi:uncharacterized membrane protein YfcA
MKIFGIFLITIGFVMLILNGIDYTKKEKILEVDSLEITKKERKTLTWPYYSGAIAIIGGILLVLGGSKKINLFNIYKKR